MEIKDIITSILAALIFNLIFGSEKERKATRKRLHSILLQINYAVETPIGKTVVNSLVILLIMCAAVLGALNLFIINAGKQAAMAVYSRTCYFCGICSSIGSNYLQTKSIER